MSNYIQEITWGKNIVTPSMKQQKRNSRIKTKAKNIGRTLSKNINFMGKTIGKGVYSQARAIKSEQVRHGGFYNLQGKSINPKEKKHKSKSVYIKRGKKYIKVKQKHSKSNNSNLRSSYNPLNPFNLDF